MILDLCGGEVSRITSDQSINYEKKIIKYEYSKTKSLGGADIDLNHQVKILNIWAL